jgi:integrase
MPPASLRPHKVASRIGTGKAAWCLNVPPQLSETGKRQRRFYPTEAQARTAAELLKTRRENFGASLSNLSPAKIAEAGQAYQLLERHDIGLLDALRSHLAHREQQAGSVTLGEAFDRFSEAKAQSSYKYRQEIKYAKGTVAPLLSDLVCNISAERLDQCLVGLPAAARNAKLRRLRSVFNLAIRRGWLAAGTSPVTRMDWAAGTTGEVETYSASDVSAMMHDALGNDIDLIPFLTLAFFCGIRPEGELSRLQWQDVDLNDRIVTIRAAIAKTKRKRFVELSDNAVAWIREFERRGGNVLGKIVPFTFAVLRKKRRANQRRAGVRSVQQGGRHSFCSHWLAAHNGDVGRLLLMTGHTNPEILFQRYHRAVRKEESAKYWAIAPPKEFAKIVKFRA